MKNLLKIFLFAILFVGCASSARHINFGCQTLHKGDYVKFYNYYGEPPKRLGEIYQIRSLIFYSDNFGNDAYVMLFDFDRGDGKPVSLGSILAKLADLIKCDKYGNVISEEECCPCEKDYKRDKDGEYYPDFVIKDFMTMPMATMPSLDTTGTIRIKEE